MADSESIYELLAPSFDLEQDATPVPLLTDRITSEYINRLTTLSIAELTSTEPASLSQASSSLSRNIQALSKRSHKAISSSAVRLATLSTDLPALSQHAKGVKEGLPAVERKAAAFAEKYRRTGTIHDHSQNPVLLARRNALLLSTNAERLSNVLDLPTLLSSAIASGQTQSTPSTSLSSMRPTTPTVILLGSPSGSGGAVGPNTAAASSTISSSVNYGSALDLHAHVRRLASLHPKSPLIQSIAKQADKEMKQLTANLIAALQAPGLKLAGGMRTVGWLRRVAPDLLSADTEPPNASGTALKHIGKDATSGNTEGSLGALFLTCRLHSLGQQLGALAPLQALSDAESASRKSTSTAAPKKSSSSSSSSRQTAAPITTSSGQQTERYLKRYIEIFREQSFAMVSMYRSIFPSALPLPTTDTSPMTAHTNTTLLPRPSPLATFCPHLSSVLFNTLRNYLPNVTDPSSRESLLTQVLYCAGSLGRLGGDFGMQVALLEEDLKVEEELDTEKGESEEEQASSEEWEWERVMKKHRVQASRLELLASGVGTGGAKPREVSATV
jgi:conserved oligomeric Golgi complex subunit 8